jgi:hypothetical protein
MLTGETGPLAARSNRCSFEDHPATVVARAGTEVDDPVGMRHDRLVVLDDDDGFARVDEPIEQGQELLDVGEVRPGSLER